MSDKVYKITDCRKKLSERKKKIIQRTAVGGIFIVGLILMIDDFISEPEDVESETEQSENPQ